MYRQMLKKQKQIEGQINRQVKDESGYRYQKAKNRFMYRQMFKF